MKRVFFTTNGYFPTRKKDVFSSEKEMVKKNFANNFLMFSHHRLQLPSHIKHSGLNPPHGQSKKLITLLVYVRMNLQWELIQCTLTRAKINSFPNL